MNLKNLFDINSVSTPRQRDVCALKRNNCVKDLLRHKHLENLNDVLSGIGQFIAQDFAIQSFEENPVDQGLRQIVANQIIGSNIHKPGTEEERALLKECKELLGAGILPDNTVQMRIFNLIKGPDSGSEPKGSPVPDPAPSKPPALRVSLPIPAPE